MLKNYSHIVLSLLCLLFTLIGCNSPVDSPHSSLNWEQKTSFPDGPRSSSSVATVVDKAYVMFGRNSTGGKGSYKNDCWEYNSEEDVWAQKSPCPGVPRVKAVAIAIEGKIYTGLGYAGDVLFQDDAYLKDFWMYNPETDTWQEKARAPFKGTDACSAFVYNDEIYVGMGFYNIEFGLEWWKYSTETDSWVQVNNFPDLPRAGGVLCYNNQYILFGTGYKTYNLSDWWMYIPQNDSWKKRRKMPDNGRVNAVGLCVTDRFFVSAGRLFKGSLTGGHVKSDILEYDVDRDVWYDHGRIPGEGRENAIAFTLNDKGYIGLGESEKQLLNDLWCFVP